MNAISSSASLTPGQPTRSTATARPSAPFMREALPTDQVRFSGNAQPLDKAHQAIAKHLLAFLEDTDTPVPQTVGAFKALLAGNPALIQYFEDSINDQIQGAVSGDVEPEWCEDYVDTEIMDEQVFEYRGEYYHSLAKCVATAAGLPAQADETVKNVLAGYLLPDDAQAEDGDNLCDPAFDAAAQNVRARVLADLRQSLAEEAAERAEEPATPGPAATDTPDTDPRQRTLDDLLKMLPDEDG